jgi:hypothetical protein
LFGGKPKKAGNTASCMDFEKIDSQPSWGPSISEQQQENKKLNNKKKNLKEKNKTEKLWEHVCMHNLLIQIQLFCL